MQEPLNGLKNLKGSRLDRDYVCAAPEWTAWLAETITRSVSYTLYLNRNGMIVEVTVGDESPPARILPRRHSNRLSGIRAVRLLPKLVEFPRGQDTALLFEYRLDLVVGIMPGPTVKLSQLVINDGRITQLHSNGILIDPSRLAELVLHDYIAPLEAELKAGGGRDIAATRPRAIVLGIKQPRKSGSDEGNDIEELKRLCETAGFEAASTITHVLKEPRPDYFIGRGKVAQIREQVVTQRLHGLILSEDVKYTQKRNLKKALGVPVMDRTDLILHIFARNAVTDEGRLQVKIAMINQHLRQMVKEEKFLDRPGAGIGSRGPGETAQELKRRLIYKKKEQLEARLAGIAERRKRGRLRRAASGLGRVALVGYTNAGKSSLLMALSGTEIKVADQLFTTLDTRTRRVKIGEKNQVLFSDTVGFIKNLPHHLINAFHSTLEEALDADLICVVLDTCDPNYSCHLNVIEETLTILNASQVPQLLVLNKIDKLNTTERANLNLELPAGVPVSAISGEGLELLKNLIVQKLTKDSIVTTLFIPYSRFGLLDRLHREGTIIHEEYLEQGVSLEARIPKHCLTKFADLEVHLNESAS